MTRPHLSFAPVAQCSSHVLRGSLMALILANVLPLSGQSPRDLATLEVERRATLVGEQEKRLAEAGALLKDGKTQEALVIFEDAFNTLPNVPMAQQTRERALQGYLAAGKSRAGELAADGDLAAARALLDKLDSAAVAPGDKGVKRLRDRLTDPDRFPPALTAEHVDRVAEVKRLLTLATSNREIGNYDQALATFQDVLRLDPYNTAARRGMELTEQDRTRYFEAAKDHRRVSMLNDVNKLWEAPVPRADISGLFGAAQGNVPGVAQGGREAITRKLRELVVERVDFNGATVEEVVEYLRVRSRDVDPEGRGIDFVVSLPADAPRPTISLNLSHVPIEEVLRYVGQVAGLRHRVEEYAVRLVSLAEDAGELVTKTYRVPPDFISTAAVDAGGAAPADPFAQAGAATAADPLRVRRLGAKEFLESRGVAFPEGSSANYSPVSNVLIVRNTPKNIEIVDLMVEQALGTAPKQVIIEVRAIDVGQEQLKELGYDWLLGDFSFYDKTQLAGGTIGNQQQANFLTENFPNQVAGVPIGQNPITAGLRSSGDLITNQTIEDVLYGATAATTRRSPGVLSLTGVMTDPQFQVVVRALDQKKGLDLLVKPSVVAKSGQKATVQVVREMLYPTEFDPPQVPTSFGQGPVVDDGGGGVIIPVGPAPPAVVTPATPTAFEMRRVGVVLDVEPVISDDGRTVDLTITPEITDFVGFVNYGSPIRSQDQDGTVLLELTENRIFQPIFSTRKIVTGVKVFDGSTVVLGGLISDSNIVIEDKVPVLGDAPFFGRFFKSNVKQRRTRNMLIFVTTRVIDPSGARIHADVR